MKFKKVVRYLGVQIEEGFRLHSHVREIGSRVVSYFDKVRGLTCSTWGLKYTVNRVTYTGLFLPIVSYAAAGWLDYCTKKDIQVLASAQRSVLISVLSAYRLTSGEALNVVVGAMPIDLVLQVKVLRYRLRKQQRSIMLSRETVTPEDDEGVAKIKKWAVESWTTRWRNSTKGRLTFGFFPDVEARLNAPWLDPSPNMARLLTGHGPFKAKLRDLGLVEDGLCECGEDQTAEHLILSCPLLEDLRQEFAESIGQSSARLELNMCVESPEAWISFKSYAAEIYKCLKCAAEEYAATNNNLDQTTSDQSS